MLPGGREVQAEQPSDPPAYPVRLKPLSGGFRSNASEQPIPWRDELPEKHKTD
jgi:hypothetical protein